MKDKATIYSINPDDLLVEAGQLGHISVSGAGNKLFGATKVSGRTLLKDLGDDNFQPFVVTAKEIAHDIATRYASDGFFVTENDEEPSPSVIRDEVTKFKDACNIHVRHANSMWDRTHNREMISEHARRAARYLNLRPEWADPIAEESQECPYCAETIKARAKFCKFCRNDLTTPPSSNPPPVPAKR